jgi:hypothetical protein
MILHTLFAEMTGLERGGLICSIIFGGISILVAVVALFKKSGTVISPQPLAIEMVEELHQQFASLKTFEEHVEGNTARHGQLFARISQVERDAREASDRKFAELYEERRRTLERLNEQFTFIRENIAAINRELQIREKK